MYYEIIDNFLTIEEHSYIKEIMMGANFPWFFSFDKSSDGIEMKDSDIYCFQFTHSFYNYYNVRSMYFEDLINPFIYRLEPFAFIRIKANLTPPTHEIKKYGWHKDTGDNQCITAVYYVNSNNGKTLFKNGLEVESVANRIVLFDSQLEHMGTSCTNEKFRCVINFNFIKDKHF